MVKAQELLGDPDSEIRSTGYRGSTSIILGGFVWLVGIAIVELSMTSPGDDLPRIFFVLALIAGVAVGFGCLRAASLLDRRLGRIGLRSVGICSAVLGIGFGLDLFPDMWLGFLLAYTFGLFVLPVAFLVLGFGVMGSTVLPRWGKWVPFAICGVGVITYGFHALAREIWDPGDAVWLSALGIGWVLLGLAIQSAVRSP